MRHNYGITLLALLTLYFGAAVSSGKAQQPDMQEWPNAQLILTSGDTLYGAVAYHQNEEIIRLILKDGTNQAFTPVGVRSFAVADSRGRYHKLYRSYFWNRDNDYSDYLVPAFFEVLQEGRYTLVKRDVITYRNQSMGPMYAGYSRYYDPYANGYNPGFRSQLVILDALYLFTPAQKIIALRNPKRDLDNLFGKKAGEMKQYIKSRNLSFNQTQDIMMMIRHFNTL